MYKFSVYGGNNPELIREALRARGWLEVQQNEPDLRPVHLYWRPTNFSGKRYAELEEIVGSSKSPVLVNHFENNRVITTKNGLLRSLKCFYGGCEGAVKAGYGVFDSTPTSFIITAGVDDLEYYSFVKRFNEIEKGIYSREKLPSKHLTSNLWLLKPSNMNQGRGIEVFRSLKEILGSLHSKAANSQWVLQKYIEKPLLYRGRKFDIRVWVVLTQRRQLYVFKKTYIRTSSDAYNVERLDSQVHLTNNCLQKHYQSYSKYQPGNTLPLQALESELESQPRYRGFKSEMVLTRVKDLIIDTVLAAKGLGRFEKEVQFQLLGYDFVLDEDLRTWLIEVNVNPYLGVPNQYIRNLLPSMVSQMFSLVLDPVFPPLRTPDAPDFQLILSNELNLRSPYSDSPYPLEQLTQPNNRKKEEEKPLPQRTLSEVVQHLVDHYPFADLLPFQEPFSRLMVKLENWPPLQEKQLPGVVKTLTIMLKSRATVLFLQEKGQQNLVKLLSFKDSTNQINSIVIQGLLGITKDPLQKRRLNLRLLLRKLTALLVEHFDSRDNPDLADHVGRLLVALAGEFSRSNYIPGVTRELLLVRNSFISLGGLLLVLLLEREADKRERGQAGLLRGFLDKLDLQDWQLYNRSQPVEELAEYVRREGINCRELAQRRVQGLLELQLKSKEQQKLKLELLIESTRKEKEIKLRQMTEKKQLLEEYMKRKRRENLLSAKRQKLSSALKTSENRLRVNYFKAPPEESAKSRPEEPSERRRSVERWLRQKRSQEHERRRQQQQELLMKKEMVERRREQFTRKCEGLKRNTTKQKRSSQVLYTEALHEQQEQRDQEGVEQ